MKPISLHIESIAAGGSGVAHHEGRAIFVPRTAPGDVVEVTVSSHAGALRGRVLRLLSPSPLRAVPSCSYLDTCGGCDLMHLQVEAQIAAYKAIVETALLRTAGLTELPPIKIHSVYPQSDGLGYRTRARFHAVTSRNHLSVGFRPKGSHDVASIPTCKVLAPALDQVLAELPMLLRGARGEGEIQVALGTSQLPVVDITWRGSLPQDVWSRLHQRVAISGETPSARAASVEKPWAGGRVWLGGATVPATFGDPRPHLLGADGKPLIIAAGAFAQPSDLAGQALAERVRDLVSPATSVPPPLSSMVELFAGSGTLSILLAPLANRFVAVESHEPSVTALRENLTSRGLKGKAVLADADTFDPGRVDVVVLDPPRTGARGAATLIAASRTPVCVYVACEPTTMARDIAILAAREFRVDALELFPIFPQTSHVETLVRLVRGPKSRERP